MSALLQIAFLAPGLSKAELHVLLELAARAEQARSVDVAASSRDLADSTGLARSSVQAAIDSLNSKQLLVTASEDPSSSAIHSLLCLAQVHSHDPGLKKRPQVAQNPGQQDAMQQLPVARYSRQGGPGIRPGVARNLSYAGPTFEPPRDAESAVYRLAPIKRASAPADSIDKDLRTTIDRLQQANRGHFEPELFEHARNQLASHHAKFARASNRQPGLPDDTITARFLAVAEWPQLEALLLDLASERKEAGHSYAWYVTVALQRIYGIPPEKYRYSKSTFEPDKTLNPINTSPTHKPSENLCRRVPGKAPEKTRLPDVEEIQMQIQAFANTHSF